jgi:hypothetical protein
MVILYEETPMWVKLPLGSMTVPEKLAAMEAIWDSLQAKQEDFDLPEWHKQVLKERQHPGEIGEGGLSDWENAKHGLQGLGP